MLTGAVLQAEGSISRTREVSLPGRSLAPLEKARGFGVTHFLKRYCPAAAASTGWYAG